MNSRCQWRFSLVQYVGFAVSAVMLLPGLCLGQHISWERLCEGLMVSVWKPIQSCPTLPTMLVVDLDPERTRFSVHHYAQEGFAQPPKIGEWQQRTGHQRGLDAAAQPRFRRLPGANRPDHLPLQRR